jgi:diguanylate cyclase (GGDEF)-like protein
MEQTVPDRRSSLRRPTIANQAHIEWLEKGKLRESEARLVDISRDGALLVTDAAPPLRTTVWVTIYKPSQANEVEASVVRHDPSNRVGLSLHGPCPKDLYLAAMFGIDARRDACDAVDVETRRPLDVVESRDETSLAGPIRRALTILMVEDDTHLIWVVSRHLNRLGHRVIAASDGAEAWSLLQHRRVQVILSDWMMPVMDGLELCRRIRSRKDVPYTYVIVVTARSGSEDRLNALAAGVDDFMTKPLDMRELEARLEIARRLLAVQEEMQKKNARLAELATIDPLTGLGNRLRLTEALANYTSLAARTGMPLSLIILDVDEFKRYNDTYGHPAGDEVLRVLSASLRENAREYDIVSRYGGEEFALLLPGTDVDAALCLAERIRAAIEQIPWVLRPITSSFGVATLSADAAGPAVLIQQADQALYHSKNHGRNRVTHYHSLQEGIDSPYRPPRASRPERLTPEDDCPLDAPLWQAIGAKRLRGTLGKTAWLDRVNKCQPGGEQPNPDTSARSEPCDLNVYLNQMIDAMIEAWTRVLALRDDETSEHTQRVTQMTVRLVYAMGIEGEDLVQVRRGSLLHDIGKIAIPDEILRKPGPLDGEEWTIMRRHPEHARELLAPIAVLRPALDIPYCHHERWDGSGYPQGLRGEKIPLTARSFAAVDIWDALSSDRPYRKRWPCDLVHNHLRTIAGTHLDPAVVEVFMRILAG